MRGLRGRKSEIAAMHARVLVGTDDVEYFLFVEHILADAGLGARLADGNEVCAQSIDWKPHVIVLECRPDSFSAAKVCADLKKESATREIPIISVVSPGAEQEHVQLLKAGVDDTFTRPLPPAQLVQCIHAKVASLGTSSPSSQEVSPEDGSLLSYADIEMNLNTYRVERNGEEVLLGPKEFRLLRHLMNNPERVFSRDELIGAAWQPNAYVAERTVDVHMGRLRKSLKSKIGRDVIRTVRSAGYALSD